MLETSITWYHTIFVIFLRLHFQFTLINYIYAVFSGDFSHGNTGQNNDQIVFTILLVFSHGNTG